MPRKTHRSYALGTVFPPEATVTPDEITLCGRYWASGLIRAEPPTKPTCLVSLAVLQN